MAKERKIGIQRVPRVQLDKMIQGRASHQGVVAVVGEYDYREWDEVLDEVRGRGEDPLFVVLDGVQDPRNLGAIIRSAYLFGAHCIVIPEHGSAKVTAATTKVAAGATEYLPVSIVKNLRRTLDEMKERGFWHAEVAVSPKSVPVWELDCKGALSLVLGSEGKGVRPLVSKCCDYFVNIPMSEVHQRSNVDSLNVSVAASVVLYEVSKTRAGTKSN